MNSWYHRITESKCLLCQYSVHKSLQLYSFLADINIKILVENSTAGTTCIDTDKQRLVRIYRVGIPRMVQYNKYSGIC